MNNTITSLLLLLTLSFSIENVKSQTEIEAAIIGISGGCSTNNGGCEQLCSINGEGRSVCSCTLNANKFILDGPFYSITFCLGINVKLILFYQSLYIKYRIESNPNHGYYH